LTEKPTEKSTEKPTEKSNDKLLLHVCCGPCSIYPLELLNLRFKTTCYFYNPNIYPESEYRRRFETMKIYADYAGIKLEYNKAGDDFNDFIFAISENKAKRCEICYMIRLDMTAQKAAIEGYDYYSTTLLYSIYMDHQKVKSIGESLGELHGVDFYYSDFREGWRKGVEVSKEMGMYRQNYCGCIYSLEDRTERLKMKEQKKSETGGR